MIFGDRYVASSGVVATGGTGSMIVCDDPNLDRKVAIKFLQAHIPRRRIQDEIAALQRIRSKHVVEIFDVVVYQPGNQLGIVQEYLPGEDLADFRARGAPAADIYLRVLYQIACGLNDIHEQGVIHRDIKPNNMKFDAEGLLKIFDFGLSREDGPNAQTVGFRGTPGFAAPELYLGYRGGTVMFTKAVDVYAFGATALYLAAGSMPPELATYPLPPSPDAWIATQGFANVGIAIPPQVVSLLDGCLSTLPDSRPPIANVRDALAAHLLYGRHRALLTHNGRTVVCEQSRPRATANYSGHSIAVSYDGHQFSVAHLAGNVFINNQVATLGMLIPGSCVLTLGAGPARDFVTVDISHPEVVL